MSRPRKMHKPLYMGFDGVIEQIADRTNNPTFNTYFIYILNPARPKDVEKFLNALGAKPLMGPQYQPPGSSYELSTNEALAKIWFKLAVKVQKQGFLFILDLTTQKEASYGKLAKRKLRIPNSDWDIAAAQFLEDHRAFD